MLTLLAHTGNYFQANSVLHDFHLLKDQDATCQDEKTIINLKSPSLYCIQLQINMKVSEFQ